MPESRKTIMNYSVKMLSVVSGITVVWCTVSGILMEFSTFINPLFQEYPNLICSLMRGEIMSEMIILNFALIQILRLFLVYDSYAFLAINHEKVFRIIFVIFWTIFLSENIFCIINSGTLCTSIKVKRMLSLHNIDNFKDLKQSPPLWLLFGLIMLIASIAFGILKRIRFREQPKVTQQLNSSNQSQSHCLEKPNSVYIISQYSARFKSYSSTDVHREDTSNQSNQIEVACSSPKTLDINGLNQLPVGTMDTNNGTADTAIKQAWIPIEEKSASSGNFVLLCNIIRARR